MDRLVELGRLLDFYGELLTQRQRETVRQYALNDYSLSEIADLTGVTRQAVRDTLEHAGDAMRGWEAKLGLMARSAAFQARRRELEALLAQLPLTGEQHSQLSKRIEALCQVWEDENGV